MSTTKGRTIRGLDAEQRREQRREQLIDAALELFASQGFVNTSIEQLCQQAFVGTKAFYEAFASKDELYAALLQRVVDRAMARVTADLDLSRPEDELAPALLGDYVHALVDDLRVAKVTFGEGMAMTPIAERQRRANRRFIATFIEGLWRSFGDDADAANHDIAIGLVGGMLDIVADWLVHDEAEREPVDVLIQRITRFYGAVRTGMH